MVFHNESSITGRNAYYVPTAAEFNSHGQNLWSAQAMLALFLSCS